METCNTSQLDEALKLQREGETLVQQNKLDEGLAKFNGLLALLGKACPKDRRAKAEMWIGWVAHVRGDKPGAQRRFRYAAKLMAPYKEHYPREWIWLCSMITRVEGRRASDAAADALRGLLRKASANASISVPLWEQVDFSGATETSWLDDQNQLSTLALRDLPGRSAMRKRVRSLYVGGLHHFHCGKDAVYYATWGAGNVQPSVMRLRGWNRIPQCILRPGELDANTYFAGFSISPNGRYMAYALGIGGSDRITIRIKDLSRNRVLKDVIADLHFFRLTWHDDSSFYYVRDQEVILHHIGTRTKYDTVVFNAPPNTYVAPWVVHRKWLFIFAYPYGSNRLIYYRRRLDGTRWTVHKDVGGKDGRYAWFRNNELFVRSFRGTNLGKLVAYNMTKRTTRHVMRPSDGWHMRHVNYLDDDLVTMLVSKQMRNAMHIYKKGNRVDELEMPPLTVAYQAGRMNEKNVLIRMESPILPPTYVETCPQSLAQVVRFRTEVEFDTDAYEQSLHWATSFDGAKVPICIVKRKDVALADTPVKLYVYGGFSKAQIPHSWCPYNGALLQMGCSLAFAGVRGGDELGQEWYRASLHGRTIVSMRDTVASAEYLQSLGVPSSRIALEGGSNGGLVTAGAIALSPSSFACAVITNPVIDVTSCGDRYEAEYGHPIRHKARIKEYAPLELLRPASYPAVLVKVHANDDRVPPSNGYRFVAKLQAVQEGDAPILLRVYQGAGHSGWVSGSTAGEDAYLFFAKHLGLRVR